ncbi:hypothetical protein TruAng_011524 [Truncatella angustata]|nr:hypothetical protein TruAng_011524 [Truncatella angustata]
MAEETLSSSCSRLTLSPLPPSPQPISPSLLSFVLLGSRVGAATQVAIARRGLSSFCAFPPESELKHRERRGGGGRGGGGVSGGRGFLEACCLPPQCGVLLVATGVADVLFLCAGQRRRPLQPVRGAGYERVRLVDECRPGLGKANAETRSIEVDN